MSISIGVVQSALVPYASRNYRRLDCLSPLHNTGYHSVSTLPVIPNIATLEFINPAKPGFLISRLYHGIRNKLQAFQFCASFLLCPEGDSDEVLALVVEDTFRNREFCLRAKVINCNTC